MNAAQIHLFLVHLPVTGFLFSALLLMLGRVRRQELLLRWTRVGVIGFGALAVVTYLTGEGAEEFLENLQLADSHRIGAHETAATVSVILAGAAALLHGLGWWKEKFKRLAGLGDVVVICAAVSLGWTAHKGGLIRHHELEISNPEAETQGLDKKANLDGGFLRTKPAPSGSIPPQDVPQPEDSAPSAPGAAEASPPRELGMPPEDGTQKLKIIDGPIQDVPNIESDAPPEEGQENRD